MEEIRRIVEQKLLQEGIERSRLRLYGHVKRMEENRMSRRLLEEKMEIRKFRGCLRDN